MAESPAVAIVGAGMAGLSAAHYLSINHIDFELFEAADQPGGRVATQQLDGLTLDRGFQIVLEDYPELRRLTTVSQLPLHRFYPGLYIPTAAGPELLSDPRRIPGMWRNTLNQAKGFLQAPDLRALVHFFATQNPTIDDLGALLPDRFRTTVFSPLFRGITLDSEITGRAQFATFIGRRFANGFASIPTEGMAQLPRILASTLGEHIHYQHKVVSVATGRLDFENGTTSEPDWIILAVDPPSLEPLLNLKLPAMRSVGVVHALSAERLFGVPAVLIPPIESPLYTVAPMSDVSPSYVNYDPELHLITASYDPALDPAQLQQTLAATLNVEADRIEIVQYEIVTNALPRPARTAAEIGRHVILAGDHVDSPSMNGAIRSGRMAAERIIRHTVPTGQRPVVDAQA